MSPDPNSFRSKLERAEFDTERNADMPDGARMASLCASLIDRHLKAGGAEAANEIMLLGRQFDQAAATPGVVLPEADAVRIYAAFAEALLEHGYAKQAETALAFARELQRKLGRLSYRDPRAHKVVDAMRRAGAVQEGLVAIRKSRLGGE